MGEQRDPESTHGLVENDGNSDSSTVDTSGDLAQLSSSARIQQRPFLDTAGVATVIHNLPNLSEFPLYDSTPFFPFENNFNNNLQALSVCLSLFFPFILFLHSYPPSFSHPDEKTRCYQKSIP